MKTLELPELSLVALVGASGSGKSTFARKHFRPTEILSSDYFRGLVSDDENDQSSTPDAFDPRPLADSASDQINGDLPSLRGAKLSGMCAIDFGAGLRNSFG